MFPKLPQLTPGEANPRAQPGHVFAVATQTAARQPISGQSDFLRTACDDGAKQQQRRFHETLSSVINHGSPSIKAVRTCEKHTPSTY